MKLKAIIHKADEGGYWAEEAPRMLGCATQAETKAELRRNLCDAVAAWIDSVDHSIVLNARAKNAGKTTYSINQVRAKLDLRAKI